MDTSTDRLLAKGEREALAQYDRDQPTAELTRNPVDGSWGYICTEHGIHRGGLTEQHARNVEAKHLREDHADPLMVDLDLKVMASNVLMAAAQNAATSAGRTAAWMDLTGMEYAPAMRFAHEVALSEGPVKLCVAPF